MSFSPAALVAHQRNRITTRRHHLAARPTDVELRKLRLDEAILDRLIADLQADAKEHAA